MERRRDPHITRPAPAARIEIHSADAATEVLGAWRRRDDHYAMPDQDAPDELRAARGILASTLLGALVWGWIALIVWLIGR